MSSRLRNVEPVTPTDSGISHGAEVAEAAVKRELRALGSHRIPRRSLTENAPTMWLPTSKAKAAKREERIETRQHVRRVTVFLAGKYLYSKKEERRRESFLFSFDFFF